MDGARDLEGALAGLRSGSSGDRSCFRGTLLEGGGNR